jgi:hypothetical protein
MSKLNTDVAAIILAYADYFKYGKLFDIIYPGSKILCHNMNLRKTIYKDRIVYKLFKRKHNENGPTVIWLKDGEEQWYYNDKKHRDNDLPAIKQGDGTLVWYQKGKKHRVNGPAATFPSGTEQWFKNDELHRDGDLPAVKKAEGVIKWFKNGKLHRENGPAIIWLDGTSFWYENGILLFTYNP